MALIVDNAGRPQTIVSPPGPYSAATSARINKEAALIQQKLDPYNWAGIAAALKNQKNTKNAAQNRIKTQAKSNKPTGGVAAAPVAPAVPLTMKQILDQFRAANNGALPPGMTPDMASLIDQGLWTNEMAAANPNLVNSLLAVQSQISANPAMYDQAIAAVKANYENLTGDVLASGKNWMQDLYGRMTDPNDPNAALVAQDPALTQYAQGMSQIDETADLNEATDLAWFEKMKANSLQNYQNLLAGLASGAIGAPVATGGGSGGGGGGGGRGYGGGRRGGGGSGGGNINNWKVPTNTVTNQQTATDTATDTSQAFAPGFHEALLAAAQNDPDLEQLTQRLWETSDQSARGMTQDVAKLLTSAETEQENMDMQAGLNAAWRTNAPGLVTKAINQMIANRGTGTVLGDNPATKNVVEQWYTPPPPKGTPTQPPPNFTEEQVAQNQLAEELLANPSALKTRFALADSAIGRLLRGKGESFQPKKPVGVLSPAGQLEWESRGEISPKQLAILEREGAKAAGAAQRADTSELPFNWKDWAASGGYVPEVDPEVRKETEKNIGFYNRILENILPWNPNANLVTTNQKLVSQGQDKSTYNTKTSNKSWGNALAGSPLDLSPQIPEMGLQSNPVTNPQGFNITIGDTGKETVEPIDDGTLIGGGGAMSRTLRVPSSALDVSKMGTQLIKEAAAKRRIQMQKEGLPTSISRPTGGKVKPKKASSFLPSFGTTTPSSVKKATTPTTSTTLTPIKRPVKRIATVPSAKKPTKPPKVSSFFKPIGTPIKPAKKPAKPAKK